MKRSEINAKESVLGMKTSSPQCYFLFDEENGDFLLNGLAKIYILD